MIDVAWTDDITAIAPETWDAALPRDTLYLRHAHLAALQASGMDIAGYRFLSFSEYGVPLGAAVLYCIDTPLSVFWPRQLDVDKLIADGAASSGNGRRKPFAVRTIECGTPSALGEGAAFLDGPRDILYACLIEAMWDFAEAMGCATLIVRDLPPPMATLAKEAAGRGAEIVPFFPNTLMPVRWSSWEGYLGGLRKRYRQRIRKNQQALAKSGITVEHRYQFADIAEELYALYAQVYARATELRRERLSPQYFAAIDKCLGDSSSVLLYRSCERLVAFDILLHDHDTLRCLYTGFDYDLNEQASLYFNLYYDDIRIAIETGKQQVEWGIASYPAKLALGAETRPLEILLLHRKPWIARLLRQVFTATLGLKPLPDYNVFRPEEVPLGEAIRTG